MRHTNSRAGLIAGALGYALICALVLPGGASASETKGSTLSLSLAKSRLVVGQPIRASGRVGRDLAGRRIVLEFKSGNGAWSALGSTQVDAGGRYRIARTLARSGRVRVILEAPEGTATAASSPVSSRERRVAVAARVGVASRRLNVTTGRRALVTGRVKPGTAGLPVRLQLRSRSGWKTVDRDRTAARGRYRLSTRRSGSTTASARVVVSARNGLKSARRGVGRLNVYRRSYASWYGPGFYGQRTACGQRYSASIQGVAHKSLPCGTKLTFRHRGRTATARVIDRGPFVGGREFDLSAATKNRLRFNGHGPILVAG